MDVNLLQQQHDGLETFAGELAAAISSETYQSVANIRWKLARALIVHLGLEDRVLYPTLINGSNRAAALMASQFKTEMGGLAEAFTTYMATWDSQRMAKEWPDFCRETRAILTLLSLRIDRENRELYPQAQQMQSGHERAMPAPHMIPEIGVMQEIQVPPPISPLPQAGSNESRASF